ncbi:MAG: RNA polymerase subunit sigma-70 [Actinomycetota bacterium]|nr:RNA polymerase subunit sigma-70 [Actinomycetota bacterium]
MTTTARPVDQGAFQALVDPHVDELHRHCYRMLGSVDDADEILQETLLAAWQGLPGFEGRASLRTWLYRIATNRCLNAIRDGLRRPPAVPVPPFEPPPPTEQHRATWVQPYVTTQDPAQRLEGREHIELAFVTALQLLPPRQTAALLLVDVLGFSLAETAELLDVGRTSVKGLLQRARTAVDARREEPQRPPPHAQRVIADRFATAFADDDIDGVLSLLTDQAWLAMPPAPHLYRGRAAIGSFLEASTSWRRGSRSLSLTPVWANDAPGYAVQLSDAGLWLPAGVIVLDITSEGIDGVTRFLGGSGRVGSGLL